MEDLKEKINDQMPKKPKVLGFYDDEEERWIKAPKEKILEMVGLTLKEITPFVRTAVRQIKMLNKFLDIDRVSFELEVQGNKIKFIVMLKKEI